MRHFGLDRWRGSRRWLKGLVQGLRGFAGRLALAVLAAGALAVGFASQAFAASCNDPTGHAPRARIPAARGPGCHLRLTAWAVGFYHTDTGYQTLVERWSGTA